MPNVKVVSKLIIHLLTNQITILPDDDLVPRVHSNPLKPTLERKIIFTIFPLLTAPEAVILPSG